MKLSTTFLFLATVLALVFMGASSGLAQGIRSSGFNGGALDTFWRFVDPRGGCTQSMTGTQASIAMPYGLCRDPLSFDQAGNRAPRIMQQVATPGSDVGNFQVYAKLDGIADAPFKIQGIMVQQDNKNYVRCEIYSDTVGLNYLLYTFDNAGNYEHQLAGAITPPHGTTPMFVRLQRIDSTWTQFYATSVSGPWIQTASTTHSMNADSMGVYGANSNAILPPADTSAPAFTAIFDYFTTSDPVVPVQLASFTGRTLTNGHVQLDWMTVSETNNFGFEVQKSLNSVTNFATIQSSFVPGHGTTLNPNFYSFIDASTTPGTWHYRLRQIDLDGSTHYSDPVQVDVTTGVADNGNKMPTAFALKQNYPNPFNPSTLIQFEVPNESRVTLDVFNLIGQKVATLVNEVKPVGVYSLQFDASALTSGVYMYKLTAGSSSLTRKMVLMK